MAEMKQARSFRLLLCVASGWFYFGDTEAAGEVVDQVRALLFKGRLKEIEQCRLAEAYVRAIGQAPVEVAIERIFQLFEKDVGQRKLRNISDNKLTKTHYSVSQISFVERCVLALFSQEQKLSPEIQRMLDEDEFLVRKKIHQDMREIVS